MKVRLLASVPFIGRAGQIVEVSDAQARNHLLPSKLAVAATGTVIAEHQHQEADQRKRQAERQIKITELLRKIEGTAVALRGKANKQGKLFAALKSDDIQQALEKQFGLKLPELKTSPDHLKTLGQHSVTAVIDNQHNVNINVMIENDQ
jgi:large subunit ribosomal protein L9